MVGKMRREARFAASRRHARHDADAEGHAVARICAGAGLVRQRDQ
jgi:hypothetical protein